MTRVTHRRVRLLRTRLRRLETLLFCEVQDFREERRLERIAAKLRHEINLLAR